MGPYEFLKRVLFFLAAVCTFASLAHAQANINENLETATVYVDAVNGNDNNPGTQQEPFQTITKGMRTAEANNQNGIGTLVLINPGVYREQVSLTGTAKDTSLPETYQAATPGTVFISGADPYTNWVPNSNYPNVYQTAWTYKFGLCPAQGGTAPPVPDIVMRREMAFVNGTQMMQVISINQMQPGTFAIDETNGLVYIYPPAGVDLNSSDVEVADRGDLFLIAEKDAVVLRGLTFEYSATCRNNGAVNVTDKPSQNVLFDTDSFVWNNAIGLSLLTLPTYQNTPVSNYTITNVIADHNGQKGIGVYATQDGLWQNVEASYNNWRGSQGSYYFYFASGIYASAEHAGTYSNINTNFNQSNGIHWDTNNETINADSITSTDNLANGLFLEKDDGPMEITNAVACYNNSPGFPLIAANGMGGLELRDSEHVKLMDSILYGNAIGQINVQGLYGGISIRDWATGQRFTVQNEYFDNEDNTFVGTDSTQSLVYDDYLGGADWTIFQQSLKSDTNDWWNSQNSTTPYTVPTPYLGTRTSFTGWQKASGQDQQSTWSQPTGNLQAACSMVPDVPDWWMMASPSGQNLNSAGQASYNFMPWQIGGFQGPVNLTYDGVSEVPGLSATITPSTVNMQSLAVFQVQAAEGTAPGTYQLTMIANDGNTTRTSTVFLTIANTFVRLSSAHLDFGSIQELQKSQPQSFTMTNFGQNPVTNFVITMPKGFAQSNNCGNSLPPNGQCTFNVIFEPVSPGNYSKDMTIKDSDPGSPQLVLLTGTATAAAKVTLSAHSISFATQVWETTSAPKQLTLENTGTIPYIISGVNFTGTDPQDFAQTNNCPVPLPVGQSCQFSVTFTPTALKTRRADLSITDNSLHLLTQVTLAGTGLTSVDLSRKSIAWGDVKVGKKSASQAVTVKNAGNDLSIAINIGGADPGDFTQTNTCGTDLPAGQSCTITVIFAPQAVGKRTANISITDPDPTSPQVITLSGTGD